MICALSFSCSLHKYLCKTWLPQRKKYVGVYLFRNRTIVFVYNIKATFAKHHYLLKKSIYLSDFLLNNLGLKNMSTVSGSNLTSNDINLRSSITCGLLYRCSLTIFSICISVLGMASNNIYNAQIYMIVIL